MVIAIVSDVIGKENNGTTIACMNLIRYLKSKNHEVRIICADQDKKGKEGYYVVNNLYLGIIIKKYLAKNEVTLAKPSKKIVEKALDGVDCCHIILPFVLGRMALKICKEKNIPVTAGFHCQAENFSSHIFLMNSKLANHLIYKNFYNHFYKKVDAIHYPTRFIKDVFEKETKCNKKAYVISNGVNDKYKKIDITKNEYQILFIGRYSKEKSHTILLKAITYSKYKDKIKLVFAGTGPLKNKLTKLARKYNITNLEMNFYNREELVKIINESTLYCHPAKIEIEAIACLEAISCGLVPIIANSSKSATRYFALDDKNLFDYNNPQDLANKIDYWLENKKEREERSKEYLGYTTRFNQQYCMKEMEKMIMENANEK